MEENWKEKAELLQKRLAEVDLYIRSSSQGMSFLVLKLEYIKIKMYQEAGHKNPHIHIDYGKNEHCASYCLKSMNRLAGNLNKKYDKKIKEWISENQNDLNLLWLETQAGNGTSAIVAEIRKNT